MQLSCASSASGASFLRGIVTSSRNDPGCIDYEFHEVEDQPGTFVAFERWANRAALDGHLTSERMQAKGPELLKLMDGAIEDGIRLLRPSGLRNERLPLTHLCVGRSPAFVGACIRGFTLHAGHSAARMTILNAVTPQADNRRQPFDGRLPTRFSHFFT